MDEVTRILIFTVIFSLSAVILLLLSFSISRRRQLQYRKDILEKEFKTREEALLQVSRDLHDEIGSSLSGINMLTQLALQQTAAENKTTAELVQKINTYTNDVIEKVSDMAWLIKTNQESLSILISKLKAYSLTTAASKNITMHFDDYPEIFEKELTIQQRKAVYLISKEALNNALKYSGCMNIYYKINVTGSILWLYIKDDGMGFFPERISEGNGVKNMKARAEEVKAKIKIDTTPGTGTTIELEL
jgi:two-component system, NarL family, sensor histidine kinase UhpB